MIKEALWVGWMDGMGLVIIGHRYSKSTFGANNDISGPHSHCEQMTE